MKKVTYILFGVFTFSVGFWLFNLRPLVTPVNLCEIPRNVAIYRSNQVFIKAYIDNVGISEDDLTYFSVFDFGDACLTGASLSISEKLKEQLKNDEILKSFIDELRRKNNELSDKRADGHFIGKVEIVGSIKSIPQNTEVAGFAAVYFPFEIKASEMKQISPIRFVSQEEIVSILDKRDNSHNF